MYKSQVRDSTINKLLEKAREQNYEKYLPKIVLKKVRGFADELVSFDFPVTAIIGPNGGGKTTILGAAACAYKSIAPRTFFAKSGHFDDGMQDWSIEYELVDRKLSAKDTIRRTATFKNLKWNRDALDREVLVFGVSRTVPANERKELLRCASNKFKAPESRIQDISQAVIEAAARILGKDLEGFKEIKINEHGVVTLLTGVTNSINYSEFHFGAGESSIIRMVSAIESAKDGSLVLIEEIENGLHPIATIRLVEYLIGVADRKRIQVVFTTHSNAALETLPSKAVWVATQDKIFQGKLDIASLRAITGQTEQIGVIFVEDAFAKVWVEAILRESFGEDMQHFEVHAMAGDGTAVAMNQYHNKNPAVKNPSICIIDGDSAQISAAENRIFRLPGDMPEAYIFDSVIDRWDEIGGKLSVALLQKFENAEKVLETCTVVSRQNEDAHLLFAQLGEKLGLVPERTIMDAFTTIWAQTFENEVLQVRADIESVISLKQIDN